MADKLSDISWKCDCGRLWTEEASTQKLGYICRLCERHYEEVDGTLRHVRSRRWRTAPERIAKEEHA